MDWHGVFSSCLLISFAVCWISTGCMSLDEIEFVPSTDSGLHLNHVYQLPSDEVEQLKDTDENLWEDEKTSASTKLDDEDYQLIKNFYDHSPTTGERPQNELKSSGLHALLDSSQTLDANIPKQTLPKYLSQLLPDGWTYDHQLEDLKDVKVEQHKMKLSYSDVPTRMASYSPTMKLLTSYNPISEADRDTMGPLPVDKVTGLALSSDGNDRPDSNTRSKLPLDIINMHDDMMKEPPQDGKVRVRMYYHRAIHDDARLYGTGPWKYWGHGWGVEFGYDPRDEGKKDYYQKGYTIERAFGRDFCKDKANCREADPEFFKDAKDAGKYSESLSAQKR